MTVNVSKPVVNVREKLAELDKPTGIAGEAMLRAETPQEQFNLIGAGRRNLIINGDMRVAQRGTSFSTGTANEYLLDRFEKSSGSAFDYDATITQSTDAPDGFEYSLKVDVDTTKTPTSIQNGGITYKIERQDVSQLGYGTSSAKEVTLSFWVKSNKTGTYSVQFYVNRGDGGGTKAVLLKAYSVDVSGVWEKKTLTVPANTVRAFDANDNAEGFGVYFWHVTGSDDYLLADKWYDNAAAFVGVSDQVNLFDDAANYWQITGVQLELGKVATPFEHRSYGEELALCQRYYYRVTNEDQGDNRRFAIGTSVDSSGNIDYLMEHPVTMRSRPALDIQAASNYREALSGLSASAMSSAHSSTTVGCIRQTIGSSTKFDARILVSSGSSSDNDRYIGWDAEL